jgi:hypothetical protein
MKCWNITTKEQETGLVHYTFSPKDSKEIQSVSIMIFLDNKRIEIYISTNDKNTTLRYMSKDSYYSDNQFLNQRRLQRDEIVEKGQRWPHFFDSTYLNSSRVSPVGLLNLINMNTYTSEPLKHFENYDNFNDCIEKVKGTLSVLEIENEAKNEIQEFMCNQIFAIQENTPALYAVNQLRKGS